AKPFQHGETGLLCVTDRERFGLDRRIECRNELAHGTFAGGTGSQFRSARWPTQRELSTADDAITVANFVLVTGHTNPKNGPSTVSLHQPDFQLPLGSLRASGCRLEVAN